MSETDSNPPPLSAIAAVPEAEPGDRIASDPTIPTTKAVQTAINSAFGDTRLSSPMNPPVFVVIR